MNEKRFVYEEEHYNFPIKKRIRDTQNNETYIDLEDVCEFLNDLNDENEQLKNELMKEKSLREYSDSMYGADLIVNIRFSNGEWRADVSVIDDE